MPINEKKGEEQDQGGFTGGAEVEGCSHGMVVLFQASTDRAALHSTRRQGRPTIQILTG
ncbi:hypothetical protein TRIUR3_22650 [Triticum urartu]|uniref:Uncharacterized protein n=1 Tax=Triticum urartu TaxID=4572 RepID=M7ZAK1_TRIUA|nr:hypothetical protein TRIUR3_22650 [Triticum urartu]